MSVEIVDPIEPTDHARFDAPAGAMGRRFLRGAAVTGASQGVRMATQLVSTIVLGRLLLPDDFGLVAMAGPVVAFVSMFADLGLNQAAVQAQGLTHRQSSSLFWVSVGLGTGLAVLLTLISPAVGWFYGDARAGYLCAAFGTSLIVGSLGSQHMALLNRGMRFTVLAAIDSVSAILGLASAVVAALLGAGYWSLFVAAFVSTVVPTIWAWAAVRWHPTMTWDRKEIRSLLSFGAGVTGFNVANFFSRNLDNVLIGRRWGAGQLGFYDRAYKLLLFPLSQITNPIARVMIPTLARLFATPAQYRDAFLNVLSQMLLVTVPGVVLLFCTAERFIPFLMGARWTGVVPIFQVLAIAALVQPLNNPSGWLFITQGRTKEYAVWGVVGAVSNVAAFVVGLPYGAYGVALAYTIAEFVRTPVLWWLVTRSGPVSARDVARDVLPQAVIAAAVFVALRMLDELFPRDTVLFLVLCTVVAYGVALLVNLLFPAGRRRMSRTTQLIREAVSFRRHP